jgi:hypothetical protein
VPDFVKKVTKHRSADLHPGETVEGAVFAQPPGSVGRQVAFGVGGVAGGAIASKMAGKRAEGHEGADESGMAESFPAGNVVLAVTPNRFLVFGHSKMSGKPTELEAEYSLDQIHEIALDKRKMHFSMVLRFVDDSVVDLDVVKTAKPSDFVDVFTRMKAR